ncbi:MAG: hypothetical protein OXI56_00730 [bacterium]|nr:hypothetical protein [bacterium]MDE0600302.1 hypothetical protein [bacterium]
MAAGLPFYSDDLSRLDGWDRAVRRWEERGLVGRLWASDPTVWGTAAPTAGDWLGWLDLPYSMGQRLGDMYRLAEEAASEGVADVVLLGMGGSSLAPEVFGAVFGSGPGRPRLTVLDSTHPDAVTSLRSRIDLSRTLFLVSSKSGTTTETLSFYRFFWEQCSGEGARFVAITDQGTPLDRLARERGFRAVFNAPADVGGRFSAFSAFGLVPAALIGVDIPSLLGRARESADRGRLGAAENPAVGLGLAMGAAAAAGMDKLTLHTTESLAAFPAWMEQLVAESLGKNGVGIVPVAGEPILAGGLYGSDRMFLVWESEGGPPVGLPSGLSGARIEVGDRLDLGAEIFRAELAVAAAGEVLGVNPFDQPDVEEAKRLAAEAMGRDAAAAGTDLAPAQSAGARASIRRMVAELGPGDYLGVQAYLPPGADVEERIGGIRRRITEISGAATTFGYGPRYLHSTGQVHKGGPPGGVFLQLVDDPGAEVQVPEAGFGFSRLIAAQAEGDYLALRGAGRRVLGVTLGSDRSGGLEAVAESLG